MTVRPVPPTKRNAVFRWLRALVREVFVFLIGFQLLVIVGLVINWAFNPSYFETESFWSDAEWGAKVAAVLAVVVPLMVRLFSLLRSHPD